MTDDEWATYLEASCKASGVPLVPNDEVTLRRIAQRLLDAAVERKQAADRPGAA